jgi:glycosyltransferase involved in cell wall biosynthesis
MMVRRMKRILEIGNWPPPVCSWSMSLVGLRKELEARGWECRVMNLNENRRVLHPDYIDVQSGWDYVRKLTRCVREGCAVHVRVNGEAVKGYSVAFLALLAARLGRRPALLTYGGGHQQTYFPASRFSFRHIAFSSLFRLPARIYCNSEAVKHVLLRTGIRSERVLAIPHTSREYIDFSPSPLPQSVEKFFAEHDGVFFSYVCFRKEFELKFLAEAIRRFRGGSPRVGFLFVGAWERELPHMTEFLRAEGIQDLIYLMGSAPHAMFLTLLSRSLAYIRTPVTDGVCSSVLESLQLKVPVLAADNGTRPQGTGLWQPGNVDGLVRLMIDVLQRRVDFVAQIPDVVLENNTEKLANDIETVCLIGEEIARQSVTLSNKHRQQDQHADVTCAQAERTFVEQ